MIASELAADLLARALTRGGDLAELYVEERTGLGLTLDDSRVERPQSGREIGASIRVVQGDSTYFGHVDGLGEEDLRRVAESVSQAVSGDRREPQALSAAADPKEAYDIAQRPESVEAATKADILRACDEAARAAGDEVAQVTVSYVENRRRVQIFNSDGVNAADDRTRVRLGAGAFGPGYSISTQHALPYTTATLALAALTALLALTAARTTITHDITLRR